MFESEGGACFFAAANSGKGFFSFYNEIFNSASICRRYLIKGGPGTGKSSFMRKTAFAMEKRGIPVEYYYCSSDPSSLDGIIIGGKIAVIDSTAPHSVEAELVGARDSLIDLGAFWNSSALAKRIDEISALNEAKRRAYSLAYKFLSSAMQSEAASRELLLPYFDFARLKKRLERLSRSIKSDGFYERRVGICSSIGMNGLRRLDTYERLGERVVAIENYCGFGHFALIELCNLAKINKNKIRVSYSPLCPELPDAVYFESSKIAFVLEGSIPKKDLYLRRYFDFSGLSTNQKRALCQRSKNAKNLSSELVACACTELSLAGNAHFALEEIYKNNMSFSALDDFFEKFIVSLCIG